MNIGIVGQGFVGSAIREGLKDFYDVKAYDIVPEKCFNLKFNELHEVVNFSDIIFVCIPTPMRKSGECDTRLLESVIEQIETTYTSRAPRHSGFLDSVGTNRPRPTLVIKSTIPPGTTDRIAEKYVKFDICFSPEFLTEANSFEDFKNQTRIIIGGHGARKVKQMFRKVFPDIPIVVTKSRTAEMVKYFTNCFLATKVTFANQMYDICEESDIDYDKVCEYALYDSRIGRSHLAVPGPDGDKGFGGHCFPKDLAAMIYFAESYEVQPTLLQSVERSNKHYRKNEDWKQMTGRAVSED